jgi:hypothetical protein
MMRFLFHLALRFFPPSFRAKHGEEMMDVFSERLPELSLLESMHEVVDVAFAGLSLRTEVAHISGPALAATLAIAMMATTFALRDARHITSDTTPVIEFSAHDPAGLFTLSIANGRPVGATLDRVRLPMSRIVAERDSIKILAVNGDVALAVAFDPRHGQISWTPRSSSAR